MAPGMQCVLCTAEAPAKKSLEEFDLIRDVDQVIPMEVKEQRMSNLLQSLMVALCLRKHPLPPFMHSTINLFIQSTAKCVSHVYA